MSVDGSTRSMRAVFIHEYAKELSDLVAVEVPVPQFPPPTSKLPRDMQHEVFVLVKVTHTSPTYVDTLYARGLHQNNHSKLVHPPFVLGTEFAGVIEDIHSPSVSASSRDARKFSKGDHVWGAALGSFAPYVVCPLSSIRHVPTGLSLRDAAGLGATTAPVSYGALIRLAGLRRGETCLIHAAAGGLGVAAVMIAKAVGAHVIGTVGSAEKAKIITNILADKDGSVPEGSGVVLYNCDGWEQEVLKLTNGKGVDVVFDTVGLVAKSIRCCAFGGRIVIVGFVGRGEGKRGEMEQLAMNKILLKGVKLLGYRYGESSRRNPAEAVQLWDGFQALLQSGIIRPVTYRHYRGIDHVPEALIELASRRVYGKIVVEIDAQRDIKHDVREEKTARL